MSEDGQFVTPGTELGSALEFVPGEGVYEDTSGNIVAATTGVVEVDNEEMEISISASAGKPAVPEKGDEVFCEVWGLKTAMVIVDILKVRGNPAAVPNLDKAAIHVSKISRDYVSNTGDVFREGDIILAEVLQARPSYQLSTNRKHLGVVRALCTECRNLLTVQGSALWCASCEWKSYRKTSSEYGEQLA